MTLADALKQSKEVGELSDRAATMAMDIAKGYMIKMQTARGLPWVVVDDAMGAFTLKLVRKWDKIKVDGNPRSYVMSMAYSCVMDRLRNHDAIRRRDEKIEKKNEGRKIKALPVYCEMKRSLVYSGGVKEFRELPKEAKVQIKDEARRQLKAGVSTYKIAKWVGVNQATVSKWRKKRK